MIRICLIHNEKPEVCKNWPYKQQDLLAYPDCTLYFKNGKLKGECNQCGECCLNPWITPPGYDRKFKDERCPYLEDINGD